MASRVYYADLRVTYKAILLPGIVFAPFMSTLFTALDIG